MRDRRFDQGTCREDVMCEIWDLPAQEMMLSSLLQRWL